MNKESRKKRPSCPYCKASLIPCAGNTDIDPLDEPAPNGFGLCMECGGLLDVKDGKITATDVGAIPLRTLFEMARAFHKHLGPEKSAELMDRIRKGFVDALNKPDTEEGFSE